tara:strand:- start:377 stop:1099 length:723 start_codon:yes stop_codon:yes gene_type:complete
LKNSKKKKQVLSPTDLFTCGFVTKMLPASTTPAYIARMEGFKGESSAKNARSHSTTTQSTTTLPKSTRPSSVVTIASVDKMKDIVKATPKKLNLFPNQSSFKNSTSPGSTAKFMRQSILAAAESQQTRFSSSDESKSSSGTTTTTKRPSLQRSQSAGFQEGGVEDDFDFDLEEEGVAMKKKKKKEGEQKETRSQSEAEKLNKRGEFFIISLSRIRETGAVAPPPQGPPPSSPLPMTGETS